MPPTRLQLLDQVHASLTRPAWRPDEVVETVLERAGDDPLDRLTLAAALAREADQFQSDLVRYFVDAARHAGHPWADVGTILGVSRQAVHKKHGRR